MSVGGCVVESANGAVDLFIRKLGSLLLHFHLHIILGGLFGWFLDHWLWWGIGMAVHSEEGFGVFGVVVDVELVLEVAEW